MERARNGGFSAIANLRDARYGSESRNLDGLVRKLGLAAGLFVSVSFIIVGISALGILAYTLSLGQNVLATSPLRFWIGSSAWTQVMLILLGVCLLAVSVSFSRGTLSRPLLVFSSVIGALYVVSLGVALFSLPSQSSQFVSQFSSSTLTTNGILLIISGLLILVATPFLIHNVQSSRIIGGGFSVVIAVLLATVINGQSSPIQTTYPLIITNPSLPNIFQTSFVPASSQSQFQTFGLFLSTAWAETVALILGSIGLLASAVLAGRREQYAAVLLGTVAFSIYGVGLGLASFQNSIILFNIVGLLTNAAGSASALGPMIAWLGLLAASLLIAGLGGVLVIAASGAGVGLSTQKLAKQFTLTAKTMGALAGSEELSSQDLDKMLKLKTLLESGLITRQEFDAQKTTILKIPPVALSPDEELRRLKSLADSGALTQAEYDAQRKRILEQL